jgi:hypothetical protein
MKKRKKAGANQQKFQRTPKSILDFAGAIDLSELKQIEIAIAKDCGNVEDEQDVKLYDFVKSFNSSSIPIDDAFEIIETKRNRSK